MTVKDFLDPVAFVDPAGSKSPLKRQRAYAAIVAVAQDAQRRIFIRYSWRKQCSTDLLTDQIFLVNTIVQPRAFGAEANAMQILYGDSLAREARQRGVRLPLVPVFQPPAQKKEWRIRAALQQPYAEGRLIFRQHEDKELIDEMLAFPQGRTMDLVDALASAVSMLPVRPIGDARFHAKHDLARHLRKLGLPPSVIEQRVAAVR